MIDSGYFEQKRRELGMDRGDVLQQIQATLDLWYPQRARARQLHLGVLRIVTPSSSVASELRMRQVELLEIHSLTGQRVSITVGELS
jgi:hypothetical protein